MTRDFKDPEVQKGLIRTLEFLHFHFRTQLQHTFKIKNREELKLDGVFHDLKFFGIDNNVNPEKDRVRFFINIDEEPGLYYQKDSVIIEKTSDAAIEANPKIGIVLNRETCSLDYFTWSEDVSGGIARNPIESNPNEDKYLELARLLVNITEQEIALA